MNKIMYILLSMFTLFLIGCESKDFVADRVVFTVEEQVSMSDYITIVRIDEIVKTEQNVYFENTVPKTFFSASKILDLKGESENVITLTRVGGYLENGKFSGTNGDVVVTDGSLEYNLYELGGFYLIINENISSSKTLNTIELHKLEGYNEAKSISEQETNIINIIQEYIDEIEKQNN